MIVAGIDLSLSNTGYAVLNSESGYLLTSGLIKTKPTETNLEELARLRTIVEKIMELLHTGDVRLVAIEGIAFMARNSTALAQLAGLNYLLRNALFLSNIPFVIVAPTSLKKFVTGKGNGPKDNIMLEIFKRWGVSISDNNIADAYGLAKIAATIQSPTENPIIKTQSEVIKLIKPQYEQA